MSFALSPSRAAFPFSLSMRRSARFLPTILYGWGTNFQLARLKPSLKPDVVLALGSRFGWNTPRFETYAGKIIHVDSDPLEVGRVNNDLQ